MTLNDFIDEAEREMATAKVNGNNFSYNRAEELVHLLKELRIYRARIICDTSRANN